MDIAAYLRHALSTSWGWGSQPGMDCCTFVAGWVVERGNPDPMTFLHPLYDSERSALLTIQRGGGLVALWTRGMIDAGIPEADERRAGDVAVLSIATHDGLNEACGIYTGERWATRGIAGLDFGPAEPLRIWRP